MSTPFIRIAILVVVILNTSNSYSQLTLKSTLTIDELVNDHLLGGSVTASNISFTGSSYAIGFFNGVNTNLGIDSGLIICSGSIDNAIGPNNRVNAGSDFSLLGDPDLDQLTSFKTYDAAVLEFDFVPTGNVVTFNYVFASEEYPEYVGSSFNDVFGFFVSGHLIHGSFSNNAQNVAHLKGTTTPISINSINLGSNPTLYFDNGNGNGDGTAPDGLTIQYDGFTKKLTAELNVICGETYHIKLAIADASDGIYDSGVFLESGSFKATTNVQEVQLPNIITPNGDGVNDNLTINGLDYCSASYGLKVYNRWGQEVFETSNILYKSWDGTLPTGEKAPEGTYYYLLISDQGNTQKSALTLIR